MTTGGIIYINRQIQLLRYIKDEYRNPSAHPEKSFFQNEAEQLFQVVNVAIDSIYKLFDMNGKGDIGNIQEIPVEK